MRRLATVLVTGAVVMAGLSAPAAATPAGTAAAGEYPGVRNILPPGQSGSINAADAAIVAAGDPQGRVAVDGKNAPPNFANQLEMYDALNKADLGKLSEGQLSSFYKDAPLTLKDKDAVRTDRPKSGVTVRWDSFGVPYIEGATREDAAFGSGYAGTKDRMFLMDLLRHVGAARAAEFLGPDEANVEMDQEQLRRPTTPPRKPRRRSTRPECASARRASGWSPRSTPTSRASTPPSRRCARPWSTGPNCPVEYAALQKKPQPWTRADVVYVASLVGGIFGKGGGASSRTRAGCSSSRRSSGRPTPAGSSTTWRSPRTRRRRPPRASRALRQRTGEPVAARRGPARPRRARPLPERGPTPVPVPSRTPD